MSEDLTMRECLMRDIHNLQDQRDEARDLSAALLLKANILAAQ
jgi:hypothetical protein